MHRIAFVAVPPVYAFDLAISQMVLDSAQGYELVVTTAEPGRVEALGGTDLMVEEGLEAASDADTVIVLGGGGREDVDPRVLDLVRDAVESGKRVASFCTGAFVLAQAGVLDGRRATTHWGLTEELARRHPGIEVVSEVFVEDGLILTSAGAAACVELCLHLVRTDFGAAAAAAAGRLAIVAPPRPGEQAQVVQMPLPVTPDESLAATREWALRRLDEAITLHDLAAHACVSTRTFTRRFQAENGVSPIQWLLERRVERARELLETTSLPMDQVAFRSGLGSADSLRQHLVRRVGVTPTAYRQRWKTPSAS
ncbi:DJ-1/PfpI family protein [Actinomadura barringtoniae]|uniref:DJ-1/PfpI family protein n=1 Tax=Actinomadura barringtoniae TaxID=1427535 RepID=A0A939P9Y7_9ACTN|nr:DJ-1/PfpI family protein [Actinomadura barringtoniae]MBO2448887.1 DJ-1/PfpI family protein [Actinomadura barringtoniae]